MKSTYLVPFATAAFAIMTLASACSSSPSRKDCEQVDYYQMGLNDGKDGKGIERLQGLKDSCGSQGIAVSPDMQSKYTYGRQVGLAQYCNAGRAADDVKSGKTDSICMNEKVPPYDTAYRKEVAALQQKQATQMRDLEESRVKLQTQQTRIQSEQDRLRNQQSGTSGQQGQ